MKNPAYSNASVDIKLCRRLRKKQASMKLTSHFPPPFKIRREVNIESCVSTGPVQELIFGVSYTAIMFFKVILG